jgi:hypothetical protein
MLGCFLGQQTPQGLSSQQQQQQIIRSQSGRPLTPSQQNDNVSSQPLNPQVPSKYDIRRNMTYFLYYFPLVSDLANSLCYEMFLVIETVQISS